MAKLRKAFSPYTQQPPSFIVPIAGTPLNKGLVLASSIPYENCYVSKLGVIKPSFPTGLPTFGVDVSLGKTQVTAGGVFGSEYTGVITPVLPITAMVCFRADTISTFTSPLSFGGNSGGGWNIQFANATQINFELTSVADYLLTGLNSLVAGRVYCLIISVTGNGGTVTAYLKDNFNNISKTAPITIGTMTAPTASLVVSALGGTSYSDALVGHVGSFAVWDRALTASECWSLINNPYQIWTIPANKLLLTVTDLTVPITGVSETSSAGTVVDGFSFAQTGNSSTLAIGTISAGPDLNLGITGPGFVGTLGSFALSNSETIAGNTSTGFAGNVIYFAPSHGVQSNTALGSVSILITTALTQAVTTSAVGTVVPSGQTGVTVALTNVTATGSIANLNYFNDKAIANVVSVLDAGNISSAETVTRQLTSATGTGSVGNVGVTNPTLNIVLSGIVNNCLVGNIAVNISSQSFALTGVSSTVASGNITQAGGSTPSQKSGTTTPYKKTPAKVDYQLKWLLKVVGSENEYLGPKIKQIYPQISENSMTHVTNNIIADMRHFFVDNPKLDRQSLIDSREKELITFYALQSLKEHNADVKFTTPFSGGLLG